MPADHLKKTKKKTKKKLKMNDERCEPYSTTPLSTPPPSDDEQMSFGEFVEREATSLDKGSVDAQLNTLKQSILSAVRNGNKSLKAYGTNERVINRLQKENMDIERRYCRCTGPCKHSRVYYKIYFIRKKE